MPVSAYNNFENKLDKLENLFKSEFGSQLKIHRSLEDHIKDMQYLRMFPISSNNVLYNNVSEIRDFNIGLELHYKHNNIKKRQIDQIMRYATRIEAVIDDNLKMTLSDSTIAYDCKINDSSVTVEDDGYMVELNYNCLHDNNIFTDVTRPRMTITSLSISSGDSSLVSSIST